MFGSRAQRTVTIALVGVAAAVTRADPRADRAAGVFPLAALDPLPLPPDGPADRWPAFAHADLATSGFDAVPLPFRYADPGHLGDPDEANAFAFLLSNDLDWSPASFCQRHAYFVYKASARAELATLAPGDGYDPAAVGRLIATWRGTVAVGGKITRSAGGFSGQLVILDRGGRVIHRRAFPTPQPYFDLLGDLSVDALATLGPPPSAALVRFLHERRCHDDATLRLIGSAAFLLPRGSPAERAVYAKVLAADPGFADVRFWAADQGGLRPAARSYEYGLGLDARVAPEYLRVLNPQLLPAPMRARVPAWQAAVAALAGTDAPDLLASQLADAMARHVPVPPAVQAAALAAAAQYPNHYGLLEMVAPAVRDGLIGPADPDLAAGVALTAFADRWRTGSGSKADVADLFAGVAIETGQPADACAVLRSSQARSPDADWLLASGWFDAGHYDDVLAVYAARPAAVVDAGSSLPVQAAMAAAFRGRADVLDTILHRDRSSLDKTRCTPLVQALVARLAGDPVDVKAIVAAVAGFSDRDWQRFEYQLLLWQLDLTANAEDFRAEAESAVGRLPGSRPAWAVLDLYDRRHPRATSADFYRSIRWLLPADPWVAPAAAAWAARSPAGAAARADVAAVVAALRPVPPRPFDPATDAAEADAAIAAAVNPWSVTAAVAALSDDRQFDAARDLAQRYANLCARDDVPQSFTWANHLVYRVADHRTAATRP